jgi:uncharacterized protein
MEILVLSDSHGNTSKFNRVIDKHPNIEYVIHLGDYGNDISFINMVRPAFITEAVQGNTDTKRIFPNEKLLQLVGKRIFIAHGHNYGVKKEMTSLIAKGREEKADVVLFGHTHEPKIQMTDGIWLINPGSISKPKILMKPTYAILELSKENINARIVEV